MRFTPPRSEAYATRFPSLAKRRQRIIPPAHDFSRIYIGTEYMTGARVYLDDRARREGMHVMGAPGSGKTTLTKCMALADFSRGFGGIVLDPNGSHDGSLFAELLIELDRLGFTRSGRVHIIDPNAQMASGCVVPINFLARLHGIDISVLADALLQAVERVWHDEDTHTKPTVRRRLKMLFMALAELGLPLTDAKYFLDPHDRHGVRARAISALSNEFARDALEELHQIALDDRSKRDFRTEGIGPINRISEFTSGDAINGMLSIVDEPGKPRRTLDLLSCMEAGDIILVNLQPGLAMSEADADLLAALFIRYVFLLCQLRKNREPFFIYADECHRYLTGDIPVLLATGRKFSICPILIHQFMAQAGKPDDLMYQAFLSSVEIQAIFRPKDSQEAQRLGELILPLNLERPMAASVRPTVVGHKRVTFASRSRTDSEAITDGEAETVGEMRAHTDMRSHSEALGEISTTISGAGSFDGVADSTGMVLSPSMQWFGPSAPHASALQYPLSESVGHAASHGNAEQSAEAHGTSRMSVHSHGSAETHATSRAQSRSTARSNAVAQTVGEQVGIEPLYADLPSAWHSIESERYRAGEVLRALPVGRCFLSFRDRTVCLNVPKAKRES